MIVDLEKLKPGPINKIVLANKLQVCKPIDPEFEKQENRYVELAHHLVRAAVAYDGIGIAANQIGINKRAFSIRLSPESFRVYFNPSFKPLLETNSEFKTEVEGCLSLPGIRIPIKRLYAIQATWLSVSEDGRFYETTEALFDLEARAFQHELDHLNGIDIVNLPGNGLGREQRRAIMKAIKKT